MGRSLATVLAAVALLLAIAFADRSEPSGSRDLVAPPPSAGSEPAPTKPGGASAFSADCSDAFGPEPGSAGGDVGFAGLSERGVGAVADRVARLRGLAFDDPVEATLLSDAEIDRRIGELIDREGSRALARRQGDALELLGAVPPGSDLEQLTRRALASQVVGLYVPETGELLVAKSGSAGAVEEITLAHELEHALADVALGFPLPERARAGSGDRDLAVQSLIEGDATLTMQAYALRYIGLDDQLDLLADPALAEGSGGLERLPDFLQRQLLFPYEAGLGFVCKRYEQGGWEAVDRAYAHPPRSTAELLGLTGGDDPPVDPPGAGTLPDPWRSTLRDQVGAAELAWLFAAPGGDAEAALPSPREAISGWAGGEATLWERGRERALGVVLVDRGEGSLCGATIAWYAAANPEAELTRTDEATSFAAPGQAATIICAGDLVRLGIGPQPSLAARLASRPAGRE